MKLAPIPGIILCFAVGCGPVDTTAPPAQAPVGPPLVATTLNIIAPVSDIDPGTSALLTATVAGSDGRVFDADTVTWQSDDSTIAVVALAGPRTASFSGVRVGVTRIAAHFHNLSIWTTVTVSVVLPGQNDGSTASFVYSKQDGMQFIPLPSGATAITANAVNNAGQVVGELQYSSQPSHAFVWSRAEGFTDLGAMSGATETVATAISQNGQVAGWSWGTSTGGRAFRWTSATGLVDLGRPDTHATGINSGGAVVGWTLGPVTGGNFGWTGQVPFRWSAENGWTILSATYEATATAINDSGEVTGALTDGDGDWVGALLWSAAGTRVDLGACFPTSCIAALAISSDGRIAGTTGNNSFIWSMDAGMQAVPGLSGTAVWSEAVGINNHGSVVGNMYGADASTPAHALGYFASAATGVIELNVPRGRKDVQLVGINDNDLVVGFVR